jgi:hypothetical protein
MKDLKKDMIIVGFFIVGLFSIWWGGEEWYERKVYNQYFNQLITILCEDRPAINNGIYGKSVINCSNGIPASGGIFVFGPNIDTHNIPSSKTISTETDQSKYRIIAKQYTVIHAELDEISRSDKTKLVNVTHNEFTTTLQDWIDQLSDVQNKIEITRNQIYKEFPYVENNMNLMDRNSMGLETLQLSCSSHKKYHEDFLLNKIDENDLIKTSFNSLNTSCLQLNLITKNLSQLVKILGTLKEVTR